MLDGSTDGAAVGRGVVTPGKYVGVDVGEVLGVLDGEAVGTGVAIPDL